MMVSRVSCSTRLCTMFLLNRSSWRSPSFAAGAAPGTVQTHSQPVESSTSSPTPKSALWIARLTFSTSIKRLDGRAVARRVLCVRLCRDGVREAVVVREVAVGVVVLVAVLF